MMRADIEHDALVAEAIDDESNQVGIDLADVKAMERHLASTDRKSRRPW